jgi:5-formyltetrahydrofolate cyclo-ligase
MWARHLIDNLAIQIMKFEMENIQNLKTLCRKAAFRARAEAHAAELDKKANAQLFNYLKTHDTNLVIGAYMPIRTEISPLMAMKKIWQRGYKICVPVVVKDGAPLKFLEWTPETKMVSGAFGAQIPEKSNFLIPDVIITPLAAFDTNGYRLGYGGGFYDRSFEEISNLKKIVAVGFAYSAQEVLLVPREATDYKLDAIITEQGILSF